MKMTNEYIKITIPGNPIVKKNTMKSSTHYKNKKGQMVARPYALHYYSSAYKEWALKAVVVCQKFKEVNSHLEYPLTNKWNMKCHFFFNKMPFVDMSNLYEAPQDILAGSCGIKNITAEIYQIIEDDNVRFIGSHDGSRVLLDYMHPRVEITLTPFILKYEVQDGKA